RAEVRAVAGQSGDVSRVTLEVDAPVRRRCAEPAAIDQQQPVVLGEWALLAPGLLAPAEAAVDEDRRLAVPPDGDVHAGWSMHAPSLPAGHAVAAISQCSSGSNRAGRRRSAV